MRNFRAKAPDSEADSKAVQVRAWTLALNSVACAAARQRADSPKQGQKCREE